MLCGPHCNIIHSIPSISTAIFLTTQHSNSNTLVHHISEGQSISIAYTVQGTPDVTYTPIWHVQSYKHSFTLEPPNTTLEGTGITARASNSRHNPSQLDCTLTLSVLGSEWGHLVVLFSAQAQSGCKVHAPAAVLVEVTSPPRPPPTPVITQPPTTPITTWKSDQLQTSTTASNNSMSRL